MESLIGYSSEDEAGDYEDMKNTTKRSGSQSLGTDDNYDNVQMDMSEDSNMVQSSETSRSESSSDEEKRLRDRRGEGEPQEGREKEKRNPEAGNYGDRKRKREEPRRNDYRGRERREDQTDRDSKLHKERDYWERSKSRDKSGKDPRRLEDKRSSGKTDDRRPAERKSHDRHSDEKKDSRRCEDRRDNKDKARRDVPTGKRDRSRSPRRAVNEDKAKRNRSRSPSSHHSTKSRSPLVSDKKSAGEKRGSSPRRGDQKRPKHSPDHRRRSRSRERHSPEARSRRSRSRERSPQRPRPYEKKPSKLSILERLGISLPTVSEGAGVITPQELVQRSMQAQVQQVKSKTGIELPSYYNPAAMNPARYAEQIQKRRLLWGNKGNEVQKVAEAPAPSAGTGNNWEGTTFAADQDGKMTAKFKRLMGIKNQGGASGSCEADGSKPEIIKKQEELFSSMEMQYEVARVATHTHRGLGLGFGTFQYPR